MIIQRMALALEYDGALYCGWQRQIHARSVQAHLEEAIGRVADHAVKTACAGRTDAGVHALAQVVHFDTSAQRTDHAWVCGINRYLPRDIRVKWVVSVPSTFDARQSAMRRHYSYVIINNKTSPGLLRNMATWIHRDLNDEAMQCAAEYLLGTHDFSAFRAAQCQAKTPVRTIENVHFSRKENLMIFDITANAFLHHMVRNIMGSLLLVGQGKYAPDWIRGLLNSRDRKQAGPMAPSQGLYLRQVDYPDKFCLPTDLFLPWFR